MVALEFVSDGLTQIGRARDRGVACQALFNCVDASFTDMRGGVHVRFALG